MKMKPNEGSYQFHRRFLIYLRNVRKEIKVYLESSDLGYSEKRRIRRLYWFIDVVLRLEDERHN